MKRSSVHTFDYEDVLHVSRAYLNKEGQISINGETVYILGEMFKVFDVTESFNSIQDSDNYFFKFFRAIPNIKSREIEIKTKGNDVTKEILNKAKTGHKSDKSVVLCDPVAPSKPKSMNNKIFISHASKDIKIVNKFVDEVLKLGLEIPKERIFCSSMVGHGIKTGKDIPDELKEELLQSSVVFLMVSKNYKESPVSLNELGGAWVLLEKDKVLPVLLPDVDFKELGFLDSQRLSKKINVEEDVLALIEDVKDELNPEISFPVLNTYLKKFIDDVNTITPKQGSMPEKEEVSEYEWCFNRSLHPFGLVFNKTVPQLGTGIHTIEDKKIINKILGELASLEYVEHYWYKFAGGDYYLDGMKLLSNGNWIIGDWELNISKIIISVDNSHQNEFILLKTHKIPPYKIDSDVGGESRYIGVMKDGTIVSENEWSSGYAIINEETVDLHEHDTEPRYSSRSDHWIFLCTYYHKIGCNPDQSIAFAKKLDEGEIEVTPENLRKFLISLRNESTVIKHM